MATIATLAVNLIGNTVGLKSALSEAQGAIRATSDKLKGVGAGLTGAVTAPVLGAAGAALKLAGDFEQTQIALKTMMGDGEKATALFNEMRQFSAATPFEFPQIAEAGKMLLAFGISSEQIIPKLKGLGDIASGVGIPVKDLALIYGQASVSGRVMTGDLNQLVGRGVPILSALAKTMGVTESQVRKLAEEGKIGFGDFDKAITSLTATGGQFSGMMDAQSQTLLGLLSTFKDNITLTLADVGTVLMETFDLRGVLGNLNTFLGGISAKISAFAKGNPALFKFVAILVAAAAATGPLLLGIGWITGIIASAIPVVTALAGAFSFLLGPIGLVVAGLAALFYFDVGGIRSGFMALFDGIVAGMGTISAMASDTWDALSWVFQGSDQAAEVDWWWDITNGLVQLGLVSQETADQMGDWLYGAGVQAGQFFDWIGKLKGGITELMGGADFANLKTEVTGAFGDIGRAVKDFFAGDISLGGLASALSDGFTRIKEALGDFFGGTDFGKFLGTIQWSEFIEKLTWENIVSKLDSWATYITALAWSAVLPVLADWGAYIVSLPWGEYIAALADWGLWILKMDWAFWVTVLEWDAWLVTLAWSTFVPILADWGSYIRSLPWGEYIAALADWGTYITALAWSAVLPVLADWGAYIASIDWTAFVVQLLDWATWVPALTWNGLIAAIDWATYVFTLDWGTSVKAVDWAQYIKAALDWGTYVKSLPWATYIKAVLDWASYVGGLTWSSFVNKLNWPSSATTFAWSSWLEKLTWPNLSFTWSDWVDKVKWPDFSFNWGNFVPKVTIPEFPGWGSLWYYVTGGGNEEGQALGTAYWQGGGTWVGERGREYAVFPRGTQIIPNREAEAMAFAGAGGPALVIEEAVFRDERDTWMLAYQVDDLRRRRRR